MSKIRVGFRLSTLMLIVLCAASIVGWTADRIRLQRQLSELSLKIETRMERGRACARAASRCLMLVSLRRRFESWSESDFKDGLDGEMIVTMHLVFKHRSYLGTATDQDPYALAAMMLAELECKSPEEYIALLRKTGAYEIMPEYHDQDAMKYNEFRTFLSRAFSRTTEM